MGKPTDPGQSEDAHTAPGKSEDAPGQQPDATTKPVEPLEDADAGTEDVIDTLPADEPTGEVRRR